jgi:hypothetical protein
MTDRTSNSMAVALRRRSSCVDTPDVLNNRIPISGIEINTGASGLGTRKAGLKITSTFEAFTALLLNCFGNP